MTLLRKLPCMCLQPFGVWSQNFFGKFWRHSSNMYSLLLVILVMLAWSKFLSSLYPANPDSFLLAPTTAQLFESRRHVRRGSERALLLAAVSPKPVGTPTTKEGPRAKWEAVPSRLPRATRDAFPTKMIICYWCEIRAKRNASTSDGIITKRLTTIIFQHVVAPTLRLGMGG